MLGQTPTGQPWWAMDQRASADYEQPDPSPAIATLARELRIEAIRRGVRDNRYYCPKCGMVQRGCIILGRWRVTEHGYQAGEAWRYRMCVGGVIDPVEDKAP